MMIYTLVVVLLLWVIQRQRKMRKILTLSRKLRNKYVALPIIGHGLMFLGTGEDRMKAIQRFAREAIKSPFRLTSLWLGPLYFVVTCDPDIIGIVSKASLGKSDMIKLSRHVLGNGSLFAPVNIWRLRRKILAPTFSTKNVNSFKETFAEQSLAVTSCLKTRAGRETFSIWKNIMSYTKNSVCQTTLGIKPLDQPFHPFLWALENYANIMSAIVFKPWLHWGLVYKLTLLYENAEKYKRVIHDFIDDIIKKNKNSLEYRHIATNMKSNTASQSYAPYSTLLELLMTSSDGSYTDLELREEALVVLIAATDTSAVGAFFTIVMLSRYLDVQEKAYEELRDIFGDSKRPVTHEDLSRLTYIEAIVKETLRLYPPVPIIARKNEEDVKLPSGITLPGGSNVGINIWGLHRNPQYWGDDAELFNPDRFLNGSLINPLAYMPFSYGPRNCIGHKYAMMSIKTLVATLLRDYKVLPPSDMSSEDLKIPLRVEFNITMKDADNYKVRLEHRE